MINNKYIFLGLSTICFLSFVFAQNDVDDELIKQESTMCFEYDLNGDDVLTMQEDNAFYFKYDWNEKEIEYKKYAEAFGLLSPGYDHKNIKVYKFLESQKHSFIFFIEDDKKNKYIVKQDRSSTLKHQFQVVLEKLSAYMAAAVGVSAQQVEIIPVDISFPGKLIIERPASIHTLMPGITLRELKHNTYDNLSIKQGSNPDRPNNRLGFNRYVISNMSRHKDLPAIAALDTFTANRDRNRANLLYDEVEDRFYAIDMALIYDIDHPSRFFITQLACENVQSMIDDNVRFTHEELQALQEYQNVLLKLLSTFAPEKIYFLLCDFIKQAGLDKKYFDLKTPPLQFLQNYKSAIEKTYRKSTRLFGLLSQLLHMNTYTKEI